MSANRRDTFIGKRISLTRQAPLGATYEAKPIFNAAPSGASVVLPSGSYKQVAPNGALSRSAAFVGFSTKPDRTKVYYDFFATKRPKAMAPSA